MIYDIQVEKFNHLNLFNLGRKCYALCGFVSSDKKFVLQNMFIGIYNPKDFKLNTVSKKVKEVLNKYINRLFMILYRWKTAIF